LKLDKKKKTQIIVAWLIVAFVIMWILSGACSSVFIAPSEVTSVCGANTALSGLSTIPIINLVLPLGNWVSMMFWIVPLAGMVLGYFFIRWWNDYFDTKEATSILFLVAMIAVLFTGFFISEVWYYNGFASNASGQPEIIQCADGQMIRSIKQYSLYPCLVESTVGECNTIENTINNENYEIAQRECSSSMPLVLSVKYWPEMRESIFLTFILGVLAAWLPLFVFEQIEKKKKKNKKE
jgi:hypothetical protein